APPGPARGRGGSAHGAPPDRQRLAGPGTPRPAVRLGGLGPGRPRNRGPVGRAGYQAAAAPHRSWPVMLLAGLWSAKATYSNKGSLIQRVGRRGSGWPVAVQGSFAVGTDGGDRAVGVQCQVPAPLVYGDQVVEGAEQEQVVEAGGGALGAGPAEVDLAW